MTNKPSDPEPDADIEDVLSSIRRLVSEDARTMPVRRSRLSAAEAATGDEPEPPAEDEAVRLVLTPAQRIGEPAAPDAEADAGTDAANDVGPIVAAAAASLEAAIAELEAATGETADQAESRDDEDMAPDADAEVGQFAAFDDAASADADVEPEPEPEDFGEPPPLDDLAALDGTDAASLMAEDDDAAQEPAQDDEANEAAVSEGGSETEDAMEDAMEDGVADTMEDTADVEMAEEDASDGDAADRPVRADPLMPFMDLTVPVGETTSRPPMGALTSARTSLVAALPQDDAEPETEPDIEPDPVGEAAEGLADESPAGDDAEDLADGGDSASGALAELDEEALGRLVAEALRRELQGPLGEKITRNVRKLVRREMHRVLEESILPAAWRGPSGEDGGG